MPIDNPVQQDTNTVSLAPIIVDEDPINVDVSNPSPAITPETAEQRSFKIDYGMGKTLNKPRDQIQQDLNDGKEEELRNTAASTVKSKRMEETTSTIADLASKKIGSFSPEEGQGITALIQNMNKDVDPGSVFEEGYGKALMSEMDLYADAHPDSFFAKAKQENPLEVAKIQEQYSAMATKREIANTLLQNIQDEVKQQSYIGYGIDLAKSMIPGYTDYTLRGNVKGVGMTAGGTLGSNIDEQSRALFNLPVSQFRDQLIRTLGPLRDSNPQMAADFLQSLIGQGTKEATGKNLAIAMDLAGTGAATMASKAIKSTVRATRLIKDTEKAASDIMDAGTQKNVSRATIAEGAGDLKEAAVAKATVNLDQELKGTPRATEESVEALSSTYRTDMAAFEEGAAKTGASKELVNRFRESSSTLLRRVIDAAVNLNKVERLPEALSKEVAVRAVMDDIKDLYPTLKNAVLDVTRPYKEKLSTNLLVDMHLGKNDGTYFTDRQTAENYIKFHRLSDAAIQEGTQPARTKSAKEIAQLERNLQTANFTIDKIKERLAADKYTVPEKKIKDQETLTYLQDEAIPGFQARLADKPKVGVEQQGLGYYVRITVPVPENSSVMRSAIAETANTQYPRSTARDFVTMVLGKYRSPEEVLSKAERQNRLAVTYSPSQIFSILKDNVEEIKKLSAGRFSGADKKKRWEEWNRMLEYADTKIDPASSKPGYFYKSPVDMSTDWVQVLGRLPDEQEIAAYFEFKRGMEIDRMFRNIAAHRNQQRVGAMTNRLVTVDKLGKEVKSAEFSGIAKREFPGGDGNILITTGKAGEERIVTISKMNSKEKQDFTDSVKRGEQRVVELFDPEQRPLNGFGKVTDERIQYVVSPTIETRALDWNQIPRRGGGHLQFDYDHYIKQAKIHHDTVGNRFWYEGDTTIAPILHESMGKDIAEHLNRIRLHLADRNEALAAAYSKQHLPMEWEDVKGWFLGKKDGDKYTPPSLNLKEPIQVVGRGETIIGKDKGLERRYSSRPNDPGFKDGTKQNSLARQMQIEFSGERDAFNLKTVEDVGTQGKPLYNVAPAKTVDPITSMQRGLQRIIKSNFYDDYKTMSVEHWLKQASPYLAASDKEIKYSPFYFYNEAKFKPDAPADIKNRLMTAKYQIDQIVGMPSETDNLLYQQAQKLSDYAYQKMGPKAPTITPGWLLPKLQDPFAFVRSIVFHAKLGLFNIPQFIVQAGNYSNILGVAGYKYAAPGTMAAQLHFWSRVNSHPNILKHLDELASKFTMPGSSKWKPGEFKEAFEELQNTGFGVAGREHAMIDDPMSNKIFSDGTNTFLDWGSSFFRAGEQNARYGAWYTAFKEYRDKNPFGRLTDSDRAGILQRADLLNVNMSRASATAMNKGLWSVPTQFYAYQQRILSLFFSSRITGKERARMLAWNAALYGVPMSAGLTGLPVVEYMRKEAIDYGYVPGDNYMASLLMEGVPSMLGALATGGGDASAGTFYDIGPRFGTKGVEFVGNVGTADKSYLDIAGGAAYSVLKSTIAQTDGLRRVLLSMATQDNDAFPFVVEDLIDPLKEITSVNSVYKILAAAGAGRLISKNEAYIADTSPTQSIISAILGVKDQAVNDLQTKRNALKDLSNYQKDVEKSFQQDFRRGMLANKQGDYEMGKKYLTRADRWIGLGMFRDDQISGVMGRAMDDNQSILDKIDMDYYIKKAPPGDIENKAEAYRKTLQIKEKKAQ